MQNFLLSFLAASIAVALISVLSPEGERGGLARHLRLISGLFLICVLISPVTSLIRGIREYSVRVPDVEDDGRDELRGRLTDTLDEGAREYFSQLLTQNLEERFGIAHGNLRVSVRWETSDGKGVCPASVTVILRGAAIWKNPDEIETYVSALIGCPCESAIE